jgi:hypothetical protein
MPHHGPALNPFDIRPFRCDDTANIFFVQEQANGLPGLS